jgi:DHA1 family multidrug resistance protein-like MFS transporter
MPTHESASPETRWDYPIITIAQFFLAFALNFMFVFLPFYVQAISPYDEAATLRWTGLIVGAAAAMATFGSTFWGNLTDRYSPKTMFERGVLSHAILVGLMGFVTDVRLLLAIRMLQGFLGGISTIGLIIISVISTEKQITRRLGVYQSALTLGQIFAPPIGAMAAAAFGYRGAFVASSLMLFAVFAFCQFGLSPLPPRPRESASDPIPRRQVWLAWIVSLVGTVHIMFLPSILPILLRGFEVPEAQRLVTAGTIVFAYGLSAAAGSYGFSWLAGRFPPHRLVLFAALGAALCQVLLIAGADAVTFTVIRMIQTGFAAGIFPLVLVQVASRREGKAIGLINTARFAGNALGPVAATFILAHSDLLTLYLVLGIGLALAATGNYLGTPIRNTNVEVQADTSWQGSMSEQLARDREIRDGAGR